MWLKKRLEWTSMAYTLPRIKTIAVITLISLLFAGLLSVPLNMLPTPHSLLHSELSDGWRLEKIPYQPCAADDCSGIHMTCPPQDLNLSETDSTGYPFVVRRSNPDYCNRYETNTTAKVLNFVSVVALIALLGLVDYKFFYHRKERQV
jgi:hypothetical protein